MKLTKRLLIFVFSVFLAGNVFASGDGYMIENENVRIQNVLAKIRRGEQVTVAALGGSITTGFNSNPINTNSWAASTGKYLKKLAAENGGSVQFYNRGVSGTDSAFGIVRLEDHILSLKPDLVILEYAMNDQWLDSSVRMKTYEGIIRNIMNNTDTAVLALFVNERNAPYKSNQAEQEKLCKYYHIPYVSWKDSLQAENPVLNFNDYFDGSETVHPNNKGHENIASFITQKIDDIWTSLPEDSKLASPVKELPSPMDRNCFEQVEYFCCDNITPLLNEGWKNGSPVHSEWVTHGKVRRGWETSEDGAEITFEVEGKSVGITYCESDKFKNAYAWVTDSDGNKYPKQKLACFVSYRNGYYGWAYKPLADSNEVKRYTVHILSDYQTQKDDGIKKCNITGIIVSK